MVRLQVIGSSF